MTRVNAFGQFRKWFYSPEGYQFRSTWWEIWDRKFTIVAVIAGTVGGYKYAQSHFFSESLMALVLCVVVMGVFLDRLYNELL